MYNHNEDHHHEHPHTHGHDHGHCHAHDDVYTHEEAGPAHSHHHGGHDNLLGSKEEAAAFLQYTLHHNAHHAEELSELAHSLQHLRLEEEAAEVLRCIDEYEHTNGHLEAVLVRLQG